MTYNQIALWAVISGFMFALGILTGKDSIKDAYREEMIKAHDVYTRILEKLHEDNQQALRIMTDLIEVLKLVTSEHEARDSNKTP